MSGKKPEESPKSLGTKIVELRNGLLLTANADFPILMSSELHNFDMLYNKNHDVDASDTTILIRNVIVIAKEINSINRANLLVELSSLLPSEADEEGIFFSPNSYGRAPPGDSTIKMDGVVRMLKNSEFLAKYAGI